MEGIKEVKSLVDSLEEGVDINANGLPTLVNTMTTFISFETELKMGDDSIRPTIIVVTDINGTLVV